VIPQAQANGLWTKKTYWNYLHGLMWIMLLMPKEVGLMKIVASDGSQKNLTHSSMIFLLMFIILKINKVGGRNFGCSTSHPLNPKKNENKIKILSFLYVSLFFFIIFFFPSMEGYPHDSGLFTITNSQKI